MQNYEYQDPTFEYYKRNIHSSKDQIATISSLRDHLSTRMGEKLRILTDSNPPIPDGDLIAYENATNDVLALLDGEIEDIKIRLKALHDEFAEYKTTMMGTDSSEEIEMMKEAAKANNRRSKRSRYDPDTGTNYALEA